MTWQWLRPLFAFNIENGPVYSKSKRAHTNIHHIFGFAASVGRLEGKIVFTGHEMNLKQKSEK